MLLAALRSCRNDKSIRDHLQSWHSSRSRHRPTHARISDKPSHPLDRRFLDKSRPRPYTVKMPLYFRTGIGPLRYSKRLTPRKSRKSRRGHQSNGLAVLLGLLLLPFWLLLKLAWKGVSSRRLRKFWKVLGLVVGGLTVFALTIDYWYVMLPFDAIAVALFVVKKRRLSSL